MSKLDIHQFVCLKDNYGVLIHDDTKGVTASIDAPDAAAITRALDEKGWRLTHIFTTHHHADHTGGNLALKEATGCTILGPVEEAPRVPGLDKPVSGGETVAFGDYEVKVLATPGHTIGHVCYWIPEAKVAFVGDTLFAMGCGKVLEGNAEMMWASLEKIARLPRDTRLYCGHEYTLANAQFGLTIEPENAALQSRAREVEELRAKNLPTLPTTVAKELDTNVFLRPDASAIRNRLGLRAAANWRVFAELRERKNKF